MTAAKKTEAASQKSQYLAFGLTQRYEMLHIVAKILSLSRKLKLEYETQISNTAIIICCFVLHSDLLCDSICDKSGLITDMNKWIGITHLALHKPMQTFCRKSGAVIVI